MNFKDRVRSRATIQGAGLGSSGLHGTVRGATLLKRDALERYREATSVKKGLRGLWLSEFEIDGLGTEGILRAWK